MVAFEKVLVGIDLDPRGRELTPGSRRAAEHAFWVAAQTGARLDFVHSLRSDRFEERKGQTYSVVHEGLSEAARADLEALTQRAGPGSELIVSREKPWLAIVHEALRRESDLVLMGKHDQREDGSRLGSVAREVLRNCPGSVWVVDPAAPVEPRKVLAATDLSEVGSKAIRVAAQIAAKSGGELHVAHAFQLSLEEQLSQHDMDRIRDEAVQAVQAQLEAEGVEAKTHVGCSAPVRALLSLESNLGIDLLVLGTLSRAGVPGLLVGNTAEKVLAKASCSLVTVKPEGFVSPVTPPVA